MDAAAHLYLVFEDLVHTSGYVAFHVNGDMVESYQSKFLHNPFSKLGLGNLFYFKILHFNPGHGSVMSYPILSKA